MEFWKEQGCEVSIDNENRCDKIVAMKTKPYWGKWISLTVL